MKSVSPSSESPTNRVQCARRRVVHVAVRVLCCLLLGAFGTTGGAHAQDDAPAAPTATATANAVEHYDRSREHYQAGRYREALGELLLALQLDPTSANLVYNVARIYELLGDIDNAIAFYHRFEHMLPPEQGEERERVEATLLRLEGARNELAEREPVLPPLTPEPMMKRGVADAAFWSFAGAGVVTLAAGATTGALAVSSAEKSRTFVLGKDGSEKERTHEVRHAQRLALSSDLLVLAGAGCAITSVLLYVLRKRPVDVELDTPVKLELGAGFGAISLGLRGSL
jgi:tetratricopeptide (TPR) repeat protein